MVRSGSPVSTSSSIYQCDISLKGLSGVVAGAVDSQVAKCVAITKSANWGASRRSGCVPELPFYRQVNLFAFFKIAG